MNWLNSWKVSDRMVGRVNLDKEQIAIMGLMDKILELTASTS